MAKQSVIVCPKCGLALFNGELTGREKSFREAHTKSCPGVLITGSVETSTHGAKFDLGPPDAIAEKLVDIGAAVVKRVLNSKVKKR